MIGVNDAWHKYSYQNGVEPKKYETVYRMILEEAVEKLPNIKIVIMGSYLLHGKTADEISCGFDVLYNDVKERREIAEKLAKEYGFKYIDLQKKFDEAIRNIAPAVHWSEDGVHPTAAGHELIKRAWLEVYRELI